MYQSPKCTSRRTFLSLSATVAGGTAIAGITSATTTEADVHQNKPTQAADTYRETNHIRSAYERMRF